MHEDETDQLACVVASLGGDAYLQNELEIEFYWENVIWNIGFDFGRLE